MEASVEHGAPVNPPVWWLDPEDEVALGIGDGKEYHNLVILLQGISLHYYNNNLKLKQNKLIDHILSPTGN